jgi:hypothetical protein
MAWTVDRRSSGYGWTAWRMESACFCEGALYRRRNASGSDARSRRGLGSGEVEFLNHAILFDRTEKVLNITEPAVQEAILQRCVRDHIRLVVLDNLSTLASGIKENDSFEWERLHNWLLHFRRRKIAVILIHHAGRSGEMRGTSKREDAAFWVISLNDGKKHADDKRGARFFSVFTKPSRNTQDEVPSYEWHIVTDLVTGEVSVGLNQRRRWTYSGS